MISYDFTTTTSYDPANRPIEIAEPEGRVTELAYDRNGNLVRALEPGAATALDSGLDPNAVQAQVTTYAYDGRDLPWRETVGEGDYRRTTVSEYDPNGNLRRIVAPRGVSEAGRPRGGGRRHPGVGERRARDRQPVQPRRPAADDPAAVGIRGRRLRPQRRRPGGREPRALCG